MQLFANINKPIYQLLYHWICMWFVYNSIDIAIHHILHTHREKQKHSEFAWFCLCEMQVCSSFAFLVSYLMPRFVFFSFICFISIGFFAIHQKNANCYSGSLYCFRATIPYGIQAISFNLPAGETVEMTITCVSMIILNRLLLDYGLLRTRICCFFPGTSRPQQCAQRETEMFLVLGRSLLSSVHHLYKYEMNANKSNGIFCSWRNRTHTKNWLIIST